MNILLTGSEGFIGSNLKTHIENNFDANIRCLDLQYGDDLQTCELPDDIDLKSSGNPLKEHPTWKNTTQKSSGKKNTGYPLDCKLL